MILLCAYLVSTSVTKEMREIRTSYAITHSRLMETSMGLHDGQRSVHSAWLVFLSEIGALRHCCVLPLVISTVPMFGLGMGLDALTVALNSLAVLFILEVDNTMYPMMLSTRQQEYISALEVFAAHSEREARRVRESRV